MHDTENYGQRRIRVAIVLMCFNYGGGEKMVSLLASHLDLSRFDVRVFCISGEAQGNVMERAIEKHGVDIVYLGKGLGFSLRHALLIWKELNAFKPDVVHTHLNGALYCAPWIAFHDVKMLHTLHNVPEKEAGRIRRCLMRILFKMGKAIPVAISETNRRMTSNYYDLALGAVEAIVNPVDLDDATARATQSNARKDYDFINVARFESQKNHEGLVRAVRALVDLNQNNSISKVRVALVGQGPLLTRIQDLVEDLGLSKNIFFLGQRDDVYDLLMSSKVFILPSNYEGLPMTILEAMAVGLPVLATSVGGIPDVVIDGKTGWLLASASSVDIAAGMNSVLVRSEEELARVANEAKQSIQQYDCGVVANKYMDLYAKNAKEHNDHV